MIQFTQTDVALIFPGQGAQEVGMGKEFYESSPEARAVFDKADSMIAGLSDVIFNGPAEKLTLTAYCQPAIFTVSVALLRAFQKHPKFKSVAPKFSCGLSLGEYSALVACGALSFEDAMRLVERRSFFMEEATGVAKGAMAAVMGFPKDKIIAICAQTGAQVANFNSPEQIVITGQAAKVEEASRILKEQGARRVMALDVSGAFHSELMRPAAEKFLGELKKISFTKPQFPILSNVDASPQSDPTAIRNNLIRQITSSVQWVDSINAIAQGGVVTFLEIGPGSVLKGLMRKINPDFKVFNIHKPADLENLLI